MTVGSRSAVLLLYNKDLFCFGTCVLQFFHERQIRLIVDCYPTYLPRDNASANTFTGL